MPVIGVFKATKSGGWQGRICTLTRNARAELVPNDNKRSDQSPDFYLMASRCQFGAAWRRPRSGDAGNVYLSVLMDDPFLAKPVSAALFPDDENQTAQLVWDGKRDAEHVQARANGLEAP